MVIATQWDSDAQVGKLLFYERQQSLVEMEHGLLLKRPASFCPRGALQEGGARLGLLDMCGLKFKAQ
jgi:hypothetical protein